MFVHMRNVFQRTGFHSQGQGLPCHQMLVHVAHVAAAVRSDRQPSLLGHQHHAQVFRQSAQAHHVGLHEVNAAGLDQIFEQHGVGDAFAASQSKRSDLPGDLLISQNVVRMRRLLEPITIAGLQRAAGSNRLCDAPALIRVDHDPHVRPDRPAHGGDAADVVGQIW